ncbi:zinc ABC transporter substrate-binding protein [Vibrio agarivorans]|uniref:zinc ABC transporter substrate-binding protein n=1 Tax=Vibrio agarivorans TaxID=153622 RepID=UPI003F516B49
MQRIMPLIVSLAIFSTPVKALEVLTSFKPIQMITLELTKGVTEPDVLMESSASPHDYALRPSDAMKIQNADIIIWFGHDLETFMSRLVDGDKRVITISDFDGIELREFEDGHSHDGHDHDSTDPHFWLGMNTTRDIAKVLSQELSQRDPANKQRYQENYLAFEQLIDDEKRAITQKLSSVKSHGYFVFHDAYGYFEDEFELNNLGHFTVSPERKPGAKTLISIRKTLAKGEAKCVFSEPQFTPAVINSVTRGSNVEIGTLDPVASKIEAQQGSYIEFMNQLADSFVSCLAKEG